MSDLKHNLSLTTTPPLEHYQSEGVTCLSLPFIQWVEKKKKKKGEKGEKLSFWVVKPTNNAAADTYLGHSHAMNLMQFILINPDYKNIVLRVFYDLGKKKDESNIEKAFKKDMVEYLIRGAAATAQGVQVEMPDLD